MNSSWDQDDPKRVKFMTKRHSDKELAEMDLRDYLASSSDEDVDEENLEEYRRKLLGDAADRDSEDEENEPDPAEPEFGEDMEISFREDVNTLAGKLERKAKDLRNTGGLGKEGLGGEQKKNSWQSYLEKKKEKKKERRMEAKAKAAALKEEKKGGEQAPKKRWPKGVVRMDDDSDDEGPDGTGEDTGAALLADEDEDRHFDIKKTKTRGVKVTKQAEEATDSRFQIDIADSRIGKVFGDGDFAIDPTHPEYRDSTAMRSVLAEKRRKKRAPPVPSAGPSAKKAKVKANPMVVEDGFDLFG